MLFYFGFCDRFPYFDVFGRSLESVSPIDLLFGVFLLEDVQGQAFVDK